MDIELEMLQRLAVQEELEDGLCDITCTYSCVSSTTYITCNATGGLT